MISYMFYYMMNKSITCFFTCPNSCPLWHHGSYHHDSPCSIAWWSNLLHASLHVPFYAHYDIMVHIIMIAHLQPDIIYYIIYIMMTYTISYVKWMPYILHSSYMNYDIINSTVMSWFILQLWYHWYTIKYDSVNWTMIS